MSARPSAVVKVGGSLARTPGLRERLRPLIERHLRSPVLVVPGGGPFADMARAMAERHAIDEATLHWMAVLGMDQYATMLVRLLAAASLIHGPEEVEAALESARLPVLAPSRWLAREDPLPHSPAVTSDSLAAWVARRLGVRKLVLVKSAPDRVGVDDYFPIASAGLECEVVVPAATGWRRIA